MSIVLKKMIAAGLVLSVLFGMVTVFAVGSTTDPLITKSYLEGAYRTSLKTDIDNALNPAIIAPEIKLNALIKDLFTFEFAPGFTEIPLSLREQLILTPGASFTLTSGNVILQVSNGTVVNVSTGRIVPSGTQLTRNQRYFCTENTEASIIANSASKGYIDGYYKSNGSAYLLPTTNLPFTDVPRNHVNYDGIAFCYINGIVTGSNGKYNPGNSITRSNFVLLLHRMEGTPVPAGTVPAFLDVSSLSLANRNAVAWARETGIVTGTNNKFSPGDPITRQNAALILYRYNKYKGGDMTAPGNALNAFPDSGSVSSGSLTAMRWAVTLGVSIDIGGRLLPKNSVSRGEAAQMIYAYVTRLEGILGKTPPVAQSPFTDVPRNHVYYDGIAFCYANGVVTGTNGKYNPNNSMTRSNFVLLLHRLEGNPKPTGSAPVFLDVSTLSSSNRNAIAWAREIGIITGTNNKFNPGDPITRQNAALLLYRLNKYKGGDTTAPGTALNAFPDRGSVSSGSLAAMRWAVSNVLIRDINGSLMPKTSATRGEAAQMIYNYVNRFGR